MEKNIEKDIELNLFSKLAEELKRETENMGKSTNNPSREKRVNVKPIGTLNLKKEKKENSLQEIKQEVEKKVVLKGVRKDDKLPSNLKQVIYSKPAEVKSNNNKNNNFEDEKPEISVEIDLIKTIGDEPDKNKAKNIISDFFSKRHMEKIKEINKIEEKQEAEQKTGISDKPEYNVINLPEVVINTSEKSVKSRKNKFKDIESDRLKKEIQNYRDSKNLQQNIENQDKIIHHRPYLPQKNKSGVNKKYVLPEILEKNFDFKIDNFDNFTQNINQLEKEEKKFIENQQVIEAQRIGETIDAEKIGQFIEARKIGKIQDKIQAIEKQKNKAEVMGLEIDSREKQKKKEEKIRKMQDTLKNRPRLPNTKYLEQENYDFALKNLMDIEKIVARGKKNMTLIMKNNNVLEIKDLENINLSNEKIAKDISVFKNLFMKVV